MSESAVLDAPKTESVPNAAPATPAVAAPPAQPNAQAPATTDKPASSAEPVYTLALPKDSTLDAAAVERATAFAKGSKLDPETAQKALEYADAETKAFHENQKAQYEAKITEWEQSVRTDKELGGNQFTTTLKRTTSVLDRFAKPGSHKYADELRATLNATGYGNYPPLVWLLSQIGAAMEADGPAAGAGALAPQTQKSIAEILYPTSAKA